VGALVVGLCPPVAAAAGPSQPRPGGRDVPPFEAVDIKRISLPSGITDASQPAYTHDGRHLLFMANALSGRANMWIVGEDGSNPRNLTGGVPGEPAMPNPDELEQPALIMPFPDGKRVFFGPYGDPRVLECTPSVVNCRSKRILDIDLSGARPAAVAPGGVVPDPTPVVPMAARPQLSPDGKHVMFSDIRTDAIEVMVLAKLTRGADKYEVGDARVLNPQGPTSPSDKDVRAWSDSTALYESKTFVDGGRAITYVQVGGEAGGNPDLWKLDLRTGKRTRLTHNADWQEDHGDSPDGRWSVTTIDSRGSHYLDYLSLMPYRSFFDAWEISPVAIIAVGGAQRRVCAPFSPRLMPSAGDGGGTLMGQDLHPYDGGDIRPSGNYQGWSMWKPDGTALALSTQSFTTLAGASYLEIARLPTRRPTRPQPIVSSQPGAWAPTHEQYHGALGAKQDITLKGLRSGTVTLHYDQNFLTKTANSATYKNYSDDGKSFLNGTDSVTRDRPASTTRVVTDLKLTGAHTGSLNRDITYVTPATGAETGSITGRSKVTFDGTTHEGVDSPADRCATVRDRLPRAVKLDAHAGRGHGRTLVVSVTAAYPNAGLNEQGVDKRPVRGATVTYGGDTATTNNDGIAFVHPRRRPGSNDRTIHVSAGDTFRPTTITAPRF
jgi:Tol biopolymer transport system component